MATKESQISQWRTVGTTLALGAGAGVLLYFTKPQGEILDKMFANLCWTYVMLATMVAGKASLQHISQAGGLKSLVAGFLGDKEKKPDPAPEPEVKP